MANASFWRLYLFELVFVLNIFCNICTLVMLLLELSMYHVLWDHCAVISRVSALAGCDRFGIRAEGYREYRSSSLEDLNYNLQVNMPSSLIKSRNVLSNFKLDMDWPPMYNLGGTNASLEGIGLVSVFHLRMYVDPRHELGTLRSILITLYILWV